VASEARSSDGIARPTAVSLQRVSTLEALTAALREQILDGTLAPASALREAHLCEAFGVSRHTVRSALQALSHEGLLRLEPNQGAFVTRLTPEDVADVYALRSVIELDAVQELARKGSVPAGLKEALERLRAVPPDASWSDVRDADLAVHQAIIDGLERPRTSRAFANLLTELRLAGHPRSRELRRGLEEHDGFREHEQILEALGGRKPRLAARLMRAHLDKAAVEIAGDLSALEEQ
jgi:DNA-binding GntR family transcriptional regulator